MLRAIKEGVLIPVKIIPKSSRNGIVGWEQEELKIKVQAPPDKGQANEALLCLLAKTWNIPKSLLSIHSGEHSRHKQICVQGYSLDRIQAILPPKKKPDDQDVIVT